MNMNNKMHTVLQSRWVTLSRREQHLLGWGAAVLLLAILWWVGIAPALRILHEAPAQQAALDAQWQRMQALQSEAQALQKLPRIPASTALQALQRSTQELLGTHAQLQISGERCTVTLKDVAPQELAAWLAQARSQARAIPVEAHWQRSAANAAPTWSGTVVLTLPAQ